MQHRFRASARLSLVLMSMVLLFGALAAQARAAETVVTISFDDGRDSQLLAADILEGHGMRGTFYAVSGRVDTQARSMTSTELRGLAAEGHEIGGHSTNHDTALDQLDGDALRAEVCDNREDLLAMDVGPISSFAYPYGAYDAEVLAMVEECGYTSGRSAGNTRTTTCTTCPYADTIPPQKAYEIKMATWGGTNIPYDTLRQRVLDAQADGGGWVVYGLHDICDVDCDPQTQSVTEQDFRDFVAWLDTENITVKTVNEVMDTVAPETTLDPTSGPAAGGTTRTAIADFRFSSDEVGATFRCQLDDEAPAPCTSPVSRPVGPGTHTFKVWATDVAGNEDATAATRTWTVEAPPVVVPPTDERAPDQPGGGAPSPALDPGADSGGDNVRPASITGRSKLKGRANAKGRFALRGAAVRCSTACAVKVTAKLERRVLARSAFALTSGKRAVRLRLNKKGRALLGRRALKLKVKLVVKVAGEPGSFHRTFTVKLRRR